jgi:hypothetical protein
MRAMRLPRTSLLVALALGVTPAFADTFTLHANNPKVGDKWTEDKTEQVDLNMTVKGSKIALHTTHADTKAIEITKVDAGTVTQAKYTYAAFTERTTMGSHDNSDSTPIVGKTYVLTAGDPIGVAAASGSPSDAEVAVVRKLEKRFGKPDRMEAILDGKTFTRDQQVVLSDAQIADALGDSDLKAASLTLTYRGTANGQASFDIAIKLDGDKDGNHITADLSGHVVADPKTGHTLSFDTKGAMTMTGKANADGTLTISAHKH